MKTLALAAISCLLLAACNNESNTTKTSRTDTAATQPADRSGGHSLELVFSDSTYQLTGVAKEEGGQLLVNYPRWAGPYLYAVVTANGASGKLPYPDTVMNNWELNKSGKDRWVCVQAVYYDAAGTLWVLDPAAPRLKTIQGSGAKLVRMNTATGKPDKVYPLGGVLADTRAC